MKNIILSLFVIGAAVSASANTKVIRTFDCTGKASMRSGILKNGTLAITAVLTDTKYTDEIGSDYGSSIVITDAENPSKKLYGSLTSTDSFTDIDKQRSTPRDEYGEGLVYYDLFADKKSVNKIERTGLLVVGSNCTKEENPSEKKCKNPRGQRNYVLNYMYGGSNVVGENARAYEATLNCKLK